MEELIENIIVNFLEGIATPSEKEELSTWLKQSAENRKIFLSFYDTWCLSHATTFDAHKALTNMDKLVKERGLHLERTQKFHLWKRYTLYASTAVIALIVALGIWLSTNKTEQDGNLRHFASAQLIDARNYKDIQLVLSNGKNLSIDSKKVNLSYDEDGAIVNGVRQGNTGSAYNQLIVPSGHRGIVRLSDGTKIWVNAQSRLVYPTRFVGDKREVYVDGEIYLEVSHHADHPFVVHTSTINVQVTGTRFVVTAYPGEQITKVVLAQGSVNVSMDKLNHTVRHLTPNHMYTLSSNRQESVIPVDASMYTSWVNEIYTCDNQTVRELLAHLSIIYGRQIVCQGSVGNLRCSGKFDLTTDLPTLLYNISQMLPVKYISRGDSVYYVLKAKE